MGGKLKITENKNGGDTIDTETSEKSKSKKDLNRCWIKMIQKI